MSQFSPLQQTQQRKQNPMMAAPLPTGDYSPTPTFMETPEHKMEGSQVAGSMMQSVGQALSQPQQDMPAPGPLPNQGVIPNQTPGINPMEQIQPFAMKHGNDLGQAVMLAVLFMFLVHFR